MVAAAMLLTGCGSGADDGDQQNPAPAPSALDRYYEQTLAWGACTAEFASTDDDEKIFDAVPDL